MSSLMMSTNIVMQGELKKRSIFNRWRKYFFILREDGIMYNYASQVCYDANTRWLAHSAPCRIFRKNLETRYTSRLCSTSSTRTNS